MDSLVFGNCGIFLSIIDIIIFFFFSFVMAYKNRVIILFIKCVRF